MDVRCLTVGPVAENCYLVRGDGAEHALIVDPGEEPDRILSLVDELGVKVDAILLTHTHFDHIGAVAPVARATGAPVYCPELEVPVLADIMSWVPRASARTRATTPTAHFAAASGSSSPRSRSTSCTPPATVPATSPTRFPPRRRCSRETSSSRARSDGSTCPAATGRR